MTVRQLIDKLKEFPEDMPVAIIYDIGYKQKDDPDDIKVIKRIYMDQTYPYNRDDFDFVNLE